MSVDNVTPNQGYPLPNSANTLSHDVTRLINALLGVDSDVAARPLSSSSTYVGTTAIALNRASAAQSLTGITSIDGSAAKLTTPVTLWGQSFDGSLSITGALTSVGNITGSGAISLTTAAASNLSLTSGTTGSVTLDSGTTGAINIGTGANTKTITLGSSTGTVQLPTAVTKIGQTSLIQGGAVNITFPTVAGTLVGSGDTGTVTATMLASTTGTGSTVVLSTSPALVTPILGTPTSGNLSNCTNVPAGQLSGTIPSTVLGNSSLYVGTTSIALNRASAALGLTGISSVALPGATSGTITVQPTAVAGTNTLTLPAATDTLIGKATTDTLTNKTFDTAGAGNSFSVNGTAITAVTGTGSTVVLSTSPSLTTPTLGVASATTINKVTLTAPATGSTLTIADGKTLTASNTVTLSGTDSSTISFGAGGTIAYLGTNNAFTGANTFTNATGQVFRQAATQDGIILNGRAGGTSSYSVTFTPTTLTASRTLTLPDVAGTVVTTGDTGSVTSTMILDGTILNADVNASAAIAGTKISPDFGSQNIVTTGTNTAARFIPSGSTVPTNGLYLPSANNVGLATNSTLQFLIDSSGKLVIVGGGGSYTTPAVQFNGSAPANSIVLDSSGRLGFGTSGPNTALSVVGGISGGIVAATSDIALPSVATNGYLRLVGQYQSGTGRGGTIQLGGRSFSDSGNVGAFLISANSTGNFNTTDLTISTQTSFNNVVSNPLVYIGASGLVGIGTTSPSQLFHVSGGYSLLNGLRISGADAQNSIYQATAFGLSSGDYISFSTNSGGPYERARIDSSGRLLVGTSSPRNNLYNASYTPTFQFETNQSAGLAARSLSVSYNNNGDTGGAIINLITSRGSTSGANNLVANNDELGTVSFLGTDGTRPLTGAAIASYVDGTAANLNMPGRLVFSTTPSGSASPTERMRIGNNGYVLINATTALGSNQVSVRGPSTGQFALQDSGTTSFYHYLGSWNTGTGNFAIVHSTSGVGVQLVGSSATSWSSFSDVRLKNITGSITDALNKVDKLKSIYFSWKSDLNSTPCVGLSGQSVREVLPEATDLSKQFNQDDNEQEYVSVRYTDVIPLLVTALQESKKRIEALESDVAALKGA
jgi:hypothetical protein